MNQNDEPDGSVTLEISGTNKSLQIKNDADSYAIINWPVRRVMKSNVVVSTSILGFAPSATSGVSLIVTSDSSSEDGEMVVD